MAQNQYLAESSPNYDVFRDAFSSVLIERMVRVSDPHKPKTRSSRKKSDRVDKGNSSLQTAGPDRSESDADNSTETLGEDLADFVDYIASELFLSLPDEVRSIDHRIWRESPETLQTKYSLPLTSSEMPAMLLNLDPAIEESLVTYGIITPDVDIINNPEKAKMAAGPGLYELMAPVLTAYITTCTTAPPPPISTKADATCCEICGRDWINLTYHHLIPRMVHDKVLKRGWHHADQLQNVAWLCGACHGFVHHFADHETLARQYYTVERLLEAPEIVGFAKWAGRLRWKGLGAGTRRRKP